MDIRAYLRVVRRSLRLLVVTVALGIGVSATWTFGMTPLYQSSTQVFVSSAKSDTTEAYTGGLLSQQRVASYAILAKSRTLSSMVERELGLEEGSLRGQVEATNIPDTVVLELQITDASPARAQLLAQTYAEQLVTVTREIETPDGAASPPIKATIINPASAPVMPSSPDPLVNLFLGALAGLLLGAGLVVLRELLDTTLKSTEDLAAVVRVPMLGTIAAEPGNARLGLVADLPSHAPRVEAFRLLRTNVQFLDVDEPHKVLVVTSPAQSEGKTSTAVNLAMSLSQAGVRTLLVDGDLRRPRIAATLGLDGSVGVTTVLLGKVEVAEAVQRHASGLEVLTSGVAPPNSAELLQSRAMAMMLAELRESYDVVLIDSPPLIPVTDGALLAAQAGGALMVVRHGRTTREQLVTAVKRLSQVDASLVGIVLNAVPSSRLVQAYGYHGYGYQPDGAETRSRRLPRPGQRAISADADAPGQPAESAAR